MATVQCAFRLSENLVAAVDEYARRLSTERPGLEVTRADVVRIALSQYLVSQGVKVDEASKQ